MSDPIKAELFEEQETETLTQQLARLLYCTVLEQNGSIESVRGMPNGVRSFDGIIDFINLALAVIDGLGLREEEDADFTGGTRVRYVTDWLT